MAHQAQDGEKGTRRKVQGTRKSRSRIKSGMTGGMYLTIVCFEAVEAGIILEHCLEYSRSEIASGERGASW